MSTTKATQIRFDDNTEAEKIAHLALERSESLGYALDDLVHFWKSRAKSARISTKEMRLLKSAWKLHARIDRLCGAYYQKAQGL